MRVKAASSSDRKYKKLFSITKGFFGHKKNNYRRAPEAYLHALSSMFKDRGLKKAGIEVNRKMLADLAVNDMAAFRGIAEQARQALAK